MFITVTEKNIHVVFKHSLTSFLDTYYEMSYLKHVHKFENCPTEKKHDASKIDVS